MCDQFFNIFSLNLCEEVCKKMPIYEYECTKCGNIEEVFQTFSDKPLRKCKQCSGKLHKLVSHSSFHLKGSGWYVTDYANRSQTKSPSSADKVEKSSKKETNPPKATNNTS